MKTKLLTMSLLLAGMIGAAQPSLAVEGPSATSHSVSSAAPDPAQQIRDLSRKLRSNDLAGLISALVPPAKYQQMRQAYELARVKPTTAEDRAKFEQEYAKLVGPDAVDTLMAEIEPKLEEARPQAPGAVMMGIGALQMAVASPDAEMTEAQRAALRAALPGLQQWVTTTDFLSSQSMRQALTLITNAARNTGVANLDQLKMLSFEEVLAKAGSVLAASKQAIRIYGLDLDQIADSIDVQVLDIEGATARVRTTVTVFDAPIATEHELVLVDGRWYGKDAVVNWTIDSEEQSEG